MLVSCDLPPQPLQGTPLAHWVAGSRHLRRRLSRGLSAQHAQHWDGGGAAAVVGCACPCCCGGDGGVTLFLRERCAPGEGLMHGDGGGTAAWGGALHASWPQGPAECGGGGGGGAGKERRGGGRRGGGVAGGSPRGPWAVFEYDNEHDVLSSGGEEDEEEAD